MPKFTGYQKQPATYQQPDTYKSLYDNALSLGKASPKRKKRQAVDLSQFRGIAGGQQSTPAPDVAVQTPNELNAGQALTPPPTPPQSVTTPYSGNLTADNLTMPLPQDNQANNSGVGIKIYNLAKKYFDSTKYLNENK